MKRFFVFSVSLFLFAASFWACDDTPAEIPVTIRRLEKEIFAAKSPAELTALFQKNPFLKSYFGAGAEVSDSLIVSQLYTNVSSQQLQQFNQSLAQQFGDLNSIQTQLQRAFGAIKASYPDFKPPQVMTAVTGFMGRDLYVSDSLIIIGLDYFGGPKATYRPQVYDYQLRRFQAEYIVPSVLFLMASRYNKINKNDNTLLADMTWYGKGYEFVKYVLPDTPDSLVIGYSGQQLTDVYASQEDIWAYFLDRKLLYQTRDAEKERFLGERPSTVEISQYCPGSIARWVGWRIVSKYVQETKPSLAELMANENARVLLEGSKYRGRPDEE
jgi:hypothetical protein